MCQIDPAAAPVQSLEVLRAKLGLPVADLAAAIDRDVDHTARILGGEQPATVAGVADLVSALARILGDRRR